MGLNGGSQAAHAGEKIVYGVGEFLASVSACQRLEILGMHRLEGGAIQENYALDIEIEGGESEGKHSLVLRTDAPSRVHTSLSRGEEFAVLQAAHAAGVTVPEPLWYCGDDSVIGREFYIMRRVPGVAAGHKLVRDPQLEEAGESLVERLGEELARLHSIRPGFPGLEFLPECGYAPALNRVNLYRDYLDALSEPQPALEWGLRWLERKQPRESDIVLCHSDYRTGNYMINGAELTGILDWEFAAWSDFHEDIGWFCARCWRFGRPDREAGGIGSRETFYRGYERVSGTTIDRELVPYWEVMASVRWAVIALQQAHRHLSGEEESLELALTGRMVPEMEFDMLMQIDEISGRRSV